MTNTSRTKNAHFGYASQKKDCKSSPRAPEFYEKTNKTRPSNLVPIVNKTSTPKDHFQFAKPALLSGSIKNSALTLGPSCANDVFQLPDSSLPGNLALLRVGIHQANAIKQWFSHKLSQIRDADKRFTKAILPPGAEASARESLCVNTDNHNEIVCIVKEGPRRSEKTCFKLDPDEQLCAEIVPRNGQRTRSKQTTKQFRKAIDREPKKSIGLLSMAVTAFSGYALFRIGKGIHNIYRWFSPKHEPLIKPEDRLDEDR